MPRRQIDCPIISKREEASCLPGMQYLDRGCFSKRASSLPTLSLLKVCIWSSSGWYQQCSVLARRPAHNRASFSCMHLLSVKWQQSWLDHSGDELHTPQRSKGPQFLAPLRWIGGAPYRIGGKASCERFGAPFCDENPSVPSTCWVQ